MVPSPGIADHDLPDSSYLGSKPDFFGCTLWPVTGADLAPDAGMIPAQQRHLGIVDECDGGTMTDGGRDAGLDAGNDPGADSGADLGPGVDSTYRFSMVVQVNSRTSPFMASIPHEQSPIYLSGFTSTTRG